MHRKRLGAEQSVLMGILEKCWNFYKSILNIAVWVANFCFTLLILTILLTSIVRMSRMWLE